MWKRNLIAALPAAVISYWIGKEVFYWAYLERGYKAIGSEYLLVGVIYFAVWWLIIKLVNIFTSMNGLMQVISETKERGELE